MRRQLRPGFGSAAGRRARPRQRRRRRRATAQYRSVDEMLKTYRLLIGGEDVDAASGETFDAIDPTTGEPWAQHALAGAEDVERAVTAAKRAFESEAWQSLSPTRRGRLMMRLADLIGENAEEIAQVEVRDNGKLYKEMLAQLRAIP